MTKLLQITDLTGKDRYYLCLINGTEIIQKEIQRYEYIELKEIENKHYKQNYGRYNDNKITDAGK